MNETPAAFGSYEVLKRLAVGGMGEIYLARQVGIHGFERLAIIKTLLHENQEDEDLVEMFLAEARIAAMLNHPGIVQIYEVGEQDGTYYIAMEFVEGDTVGALISAARKKEKHTPWPFVNLLAQAARALHHAHHQKDQTGQPLHLVHRDISPQNIMVRRDGVTKVVDFGIAKVAVGGGVRTKTGTIKGKLSYMAPEQVSGTGMDARTDIYALGVVLWEMTTCRRMFHNMPDVEIFRSVLEADFQKPSLVVPGFPPALEEVILKALSRNKDDRYATGNEMADALEAVLSKVPDAEKPNVPAYVEELIGEKVQERVATGQAIRGSLTPSSGVMSRQRLSTGTGTPRVPTNPSRQVPTSNLRTPSGSNSSVEVSADQFVPTLHTDIKNLATQHDMTVAGLSPVGGMAQQQASQPPVSPPPRRSMVLPLLGMAGAALVAGGAVFMLTRPEPAPAPVATAPIAPAPVAPPPVEPAPPQPTEAKPAEPPPPEPEAAEPEEQAKPAEPERPREPARRPSRPPPRKEPSRPVAKEPAPEAAPAADGFLTLASDPWAVVTIDGKPVGSTPLFKVKLPPGKHKVVLENEAEKLKKAIQVNIRSGQESRITEKLR